MKGKSEKINIDLGKILLNGDDNLQESYAPIYDFINMNNELKGSVIFNNIFNKIEFLKTCKSELFRKREINIKSIESKVKIDLQKKIGECLFEILPTEQKEAIISAFQNLDNSELQLILKIESDTKENTILFPWESLRIQELKTNKYRPQDENTLLYRCTNYQSSIINKKDLINVLLIDTTEGQELFDYFHQVNQEIEYKNIVFTVYGKKKPKDILNRLHGFCVNNKPSIIHFFIDKFDENKIELIENQELSFEELESVEYLFQNDVNLFIFQEWDPSKLSNFEYLEKIGLLFARQDSLSTIILPYQESLFDLTTYLEKIYGTISEGKSVGEVVKNLRQLFKIAKCYSSPIFYLNTDDFSIIEHSIDVSNRIPSPIFKNNNINRIAIQSVKEQMEALIKTMSSCIKIELNAIGNELVQAENNLNRIRDDIKNLYQNNKDLFETEGYLDDLEKMDPMPYGKTWKDWVNK